MMSVKSVFKLGAFSLVCVLSVLSLSSFSIRNFFNKHDSQIGGNGEWVIIFLVFHFHLLTNAFNSSRFLARLSNRCIYNYWTDSCWDLFSLEVCILFGFLLMQLSRSYWLSLSSYQSITILLQSKRLNQLTLTQPVATVYLSHLLNPTPSHGLFSIRLPKCIKNEWCFIIFTRYLEKNNEAFSQSWNWKFFFASI